MACDVIKQFYEIKRRSEHATSPSVRERLLQERADMLPAVGRAMQKLRIIIGEFNANSLMGEIAARCSMSKGAMRNS